MITTMKPILLLSNFFISSATCWVLLLLSSFKFSTIVDLAYWATLIFSFINNKLLVLFVTLDLLQWLDSDIQVIQRSYAGTLVACWQGYDPTAWVVFVFSLTSFCHILCHFATIYRPFWFYNFQKLESKNLKYVIKNL